MRRQLMLIGALVGAIATAACGNDDAATGPSAAGLSAAEAEALALDFDGTGIEMIGGEIAAGGGSAAVSPSLSLSPSPVFDLIVTDITFTRTRSCPLGGEVELAGEMHRERDTDTNTLTVEFEADKTPDHCSYAIPSGTISISGNPNIAISGFRMRVNGVPTGLQTTTYVGSFTWEKSAGASGTCEVDISSVLDPENHTRTVSGTFCGRIVDRTVTWDASAG
ncbi:MAG: hypothetical protein ACE5JR_06290 [Gemmatimonadota bacterium]